MSPKDERLVKLGRRPLKSAPVAHHWAIQVVDDKSSRDGYWYELPGASLKDINSKNSVTPFKAKESKLGAGHFGGEVVGKTQRTDPEINFVIAKWLEKNSIYGFGSTNCQKFALQFVTWLTNGNYRIKHLGDAATTTNSSYTDTKVLIKSQGQTIVAKGIWKQIRIPCGMVIFRIRGPYCEYDKRTVMSMYRPGFGIWGEASLVKFEVGLAGIISIHVDLNANSGMGYRGTNIDIHLLGFGIALGSDGLAVDTPIGGACIRLISWPINLLASWFRN